MDTAPPNTPPSATSPPPPFGAHRPRELRRRPDQGHIAGVCAGVADYFNVDPVIVRIATVVLAFSGPGVVAYLLAWVFVPKADSPSDDSLGPPPSNQHDRGAQIFGMVLLAASVSILWGGWWSPARRWIFPVCLMVLGAWLLLRRDDDQSAGQGRTAAAGTTPTPVGTQLPSSTPASTADIAPHDPTLVDDGAGLGPPAPPATNDQWSPGASPEGPGIVARSRRRVVAPVVMGALLLWAGIAFLADVSVQSGLAIALCILGFGFVLGAFVGGSRALIVPAILVATALAASAFVDIPLSGPVGERTWTPLTVAEVADVYELSLGEGRLDLTAVRLDDDDRLDIVAAVGIGRLEVVVPDGVTVTVAARVSGGEMILFGHTETGLDVVTTRGLSSRGDTGTIHLDLEVGLGELEVVGRGPLSATATPSTTTSLG